MRFESYAWIFPWGVSEQVRVSRSQHGSARGVTSLTGVSCAVRLLIFPLSVSRCVVSS
jgi:hypothetical protein